MWSVPPRAVAAVALVLLKLPAAAGAQPPPPLVSTTCWPRPASAWPRCSRPGRAPGST